MFSNHKAKQYISCNPVYGENLNYVNGDKMIELNNSPHQQDRNTVPDTDERGPAQL